MSKVLSDRPIFNSDEDQFKRDNFAGAIASALVLEEGSPSIVVAIEGEWGAGKTSVLNMVKQHLSQHQGKPCVIPLEAWLLGGGGSALSKFLGQLAAGLGSKDKTKKTTEVAEKILKLSKVIAPAKVIPGIGPVATIVQEAAKEIGEGAKAYAEFIERDIQGKKLEVAKSIQALRRPIVVIIDDLDRLEPEEVREVFRLVKAVADFDRVSYLLSYDPEPVLRALSYNGVYDGATYLEKIVQVAYPLPRPSYWALKRYLESRLEDFMEGFGFEDFEKSRLSELLSLGGLAHALRHPRDVNRLINRLKVSVPPTQGEVNFSDVVGFEALSIMYPGVANAVRRRPYDFVGNRYRHEEMLAAEYLIRSAEPSYSRTLPEWKKALWENLPGERQKPLASLLDFLFPGFTGNPSVVSPQTDGQKESEMLICQSAPLLKVLSVGPLDGTFSARDVKKFLTNHGSRKAMLDDIYDEEMFGWLSYASQFMDRIKVLDVDQLVCLLLDKAADLGKSVERGKAGGFIEEMAVFASELVRHLSGQEQEDLLLKMMADPRSLTFTANIADALARQYGMAGQNGPESRKIVESERLAREAVNVWLSSVRAVKDDSFKLIKEPRAIIVLHDWYRLGRKEEVYDFIEKLTGTPEGVSLFLEAWLPGYGLDGLEKFFSDWRHFKYQCEQHPRKETFRSDLWGYFNALERAERKLSDDKV